MNNLISLKIRNQFAAIGFCIIISACISKAQIAVGGNYTLTQTAIAGGGASGNNASVGGNYSLEGTIGQSAAGTNQQNASYKFQPGFWTAQTFAPTAASVNLGGRVLTTNGSGIRNTRITLTMPDGTSRTAICGTFGYYSFAEIPSGQTYILTVSSKRFVFATPTQIVTLFEERGDLDFIATQP
jgi:hypothetical protein